jgi:hypothetical protein
VARPASSLAVLLAVSLPAVAGARERVVVLPFDAPTRVAGRAVIVPAAEVELARLGYDIVSGPPVERFLQARRIRYLDSLAREDVDELLAAQTADAVLVGTILAYEARDADPSVAIAMTALGRGGAVLWTRMEALTRAQTERTFGAGRVEQIEDLARLVVSRAFATFPREDLARARVRSAARSGGGPRVYRARGFSPRELKLSLLPLENLSGVRGATRAAETILQEELARRPQVTVVGPAALRQAVVSEGLRAPAALGLDQFKVLARATGTPLVLRGTLFVWGWRPGEGEAGLPDVEIYLTLVDADSGRTLWSGLHRRSGQDYEEWLHFGAVRDVSSLARRTMAELLDAFMQ